MRLTRIAPVVATLVLLTSCHNAPPTVGVQSSAGPWRTLFDGTSLDAWRGYQGKPIPTGWHIAGNTLAKDVPVADIVTKDEFGDFELQLEWKIGEAGNSGIFYRGSEEYNHIYWSGPEYQLLDDIKAEDNKTRLTCAGAAYGIYPSPEGHLKPVGEWNSTRIIVRGMHVEHWLNGRKILEYDRGSDAFRAAVARSKFKDIPGFGEWADGHILLQEHGSVVSFRNVKIHVLPN